MFSFIANLFRQPTPVNTYDEALNMAQIATQKKFPGDYSSFNASLWYEPETDLWHFRYLDKRLPDTPIFGGIGPGVNIRKSDGKITYLKGQK